MSLSLRTNYGGLVLDSPVVVGACPMNLNDQTRIAMRSNGAGAIVLPSLFEEQVIQWSQKIGRTISPQERMLLEHSHTTKVNWACEDAESYLSIVRHSSSSDSIPIIASLNGFTAGGWTDFAGELQEAGAAAIELNVLNIRSTDYSSSAEIEHFILDVVRDLNAALSIPLFVKLGRNFTSIPHLARLLLSGAQGLVLHGRAPDTDICLDKLELKTRWQLTQPSSYLETLGMVMQVHGYCPAMPLAISGGVARAEDVIKSLLSGADVAMVTSAIYREGPAVIRAMLDGLTTFMEKRHFTNMNDVRNNRPLEFTSLEERNAYMTALSAHISATDAAIASASLHADRWGHPTA